MRTLTLLLALAAVTATLPACDSGSQLTIGGTYSTTVDAANVFTLELPSVESGESGFQFTATSTYTFDGVTETESEEGTGAYDHPTLRLTAEGETVVATVRDGGDTIEIEDEGISLVLRR